MNFGDTRAGATGASGAKVLGIVAFLAAATVFGWSLFNIIQITGEDAASAAQTLKMQTYVSFADDAAATHSTENTASNAFETASLNSEGEYVSASGEIVCDAQNPDIQVDFDGLAAVNPDVAGWILIPGTDISHALIRGEDNDYYLHHGPDGKENRAGSIFIDASCAADLSDMNTVVYGHRMNNGTMFAPLHKYEDRTFTDAHPYIYVTLRDGALKRYRIFDVSQTTYLLSDPAYRTTFENAEEFETWKAAPVGEPYYFEQPSDGNVITLSTCVRGDGAKRFIVRAVLDNPD